jgi:hypothetical protein
LQIWSVLERSCATCFNPGTDWFFGAPWEAESYFSLDRMRTLVGCPLYSFTSSFSSPSQYPPRTFLFLYMLVLVALSCSNNVVYSSL